MINWLQQIMRRPERGWDPIPPAYADMYAKMEWGKVDSTLVDWIAAHLGGLEGKRILDLGGGPGQYSVAFAIRGAEVVWHDVSACYQAIAKKKAAEHGVNIQFSLGYLEDAENLENNSFDLVFNRICWYYCRSDKGFAEMIFQLMRPGGYAYISSHNIIPERRWRALSPNIRYALNKRIWWKIGHPVPPHGRIAALFGAKDVSTMWVDYSSTANDIVFVQKLRRVTDVA